METSRHLYLDNPPELGPNDRYVSNPVVKTFDLPDASGSAGSFATLMSAQGFTSERYLTQRKLEVRAEWMVVTRHTVLPGHTDELSFQKESGTSRTQGTETTTSVGAELKGISAAYSKTLSESVTFSESTTTTDTRTLVGDPTLTSYYTYWQAVYTFTESGQERDVYHAPWYMTDPSDSNGPYSSRYVNRADEIVPVVVHV